MTFDTKSDKAFSGEALTEKNLRFLASVDASGVSYDQIIARFLQQVPIVFEGSLLLDPSRQNITTLQTELQRYLGPESVFVNGILDKRTLAAIKFLLEKKEFIQENKIQIALFQFNLQLRDTGHAIVQNPITKTENPSSGQFRPVSFQSLNSHISSKSSSSGDLHHDPKIPKQFYIMDWMGGSYSLGKVQLWKDGDFSKSKSPMDIFDEIKKLYESHRKATPPLEKKNLPGDVLSLLQSRGIAIHEKQGQYPSKIELSSSTYMFRSVHNGPMKLDKVIELDGTAVGFQKRGNSIAIQYLSGKEEVLSFPSFRNA